MDHGIKTVTIHPMTEVKGILVILINSTIYIMANENTPVCRVQSKEIGDKILDHIIKSIKLGILSVNINDTCKSFENE